MREKSLSLPEFIALFALLTSLTALSIDAMLPAFPEIASRALIRDQYEGARMAQVMSFIMTIFILVPMIAPALGQLILVVAGWRSIFAFFFVLALIAAGWLYYRQPETLPHHRRLPFSLVGVIRSTGLVLRHVKVMAYTAIAGVIFGAQVLYISTSQMMFYDFYHIDDWFPFYFALLASGIGSASLLNSQLVMRYGMYRLAVSALTGLTITSSALLLVSLGYDGIPPFLWFMTLCFLMFFCIGILFGNINAMAMQFLGRIAGLGASLVASLSSIIAVIFSISIGRFYNATMLPIAIGFVISAVIALILIIAAERSQPGVI